MARATRSSAQQGQETDKQSEYSSKTTPRGKAASKKRKRTSIAENDDQPAPKQLRSGDVTIKEEASGQDIPDADKLPELQNAGDVPIDGGDAQKILDILEMIDTQGLLDRVFPLPSNSVEASGSQPASYSFRTLLKESSQHPLCVLRSAVQHLLPISSHPRSRPSTPAAQQLGFCNLALSLLDQASFHSVPIPLDLETVLPSTPLVYDANGDATEVKSNAKGKSKSKSPPRFISQSSPALAFKRKYALMQKLSGGEWWTSIDSDFGTPSMDGKTLKDLPTAHAELVAILPSPSITASRLDPSIPTLGSYVKKVSGPKSRLMGARRTSCGSFLDYGAYASFAPSFEGEGVEVGRMALGETIWRWEERRRERQIERFKPGSIVEIGEEVAEDVDMDDLQEVGMDGVPEAPSNEDVVDDALDGLLPPSEVAVIKAALDNLELEDAVNELLERNKRALTRLEELQRLRLGNVDGGSSEVEEGSEEWDTARGIMNSLTILASLRPRSSKDFSETPPLIPPPNVLRKLHRTLPIAPTQGWYGTLPPTRPSALRDDATIHIKSGTVIPTTEPVTPLPPAGPANTASASPHPGYPYPSYSAGQTYRGTYPQQQYKPGQSYYPGAQPQGQAATAAGQVGTTQYYPNQQYGQSQYQYSPYYFAQGQAANSGANSNGRATPQPAGAATTTYGGGYYSTPQPAQRAVANTVVTAAVGKPQQQGVNGQAPPTLPPHLRNATWAGSASQPGTPVGANNGYASYQPPTSS